MKDHPTKSIKSWSLTERPREKASQSGIKSLSDSELLAILIRTGTKQKSALDIARELLDLANHNVFELGKISVAELKKVKGIAQTKAITIAAALELGKRWHSQPPEEQKSIASSKDVFDLIGSHLSDLSHEEFWVIFLNRSLKVISCKKLFSGGTTQVTADVKIICKTAVDLLSNSIILVHNHPSGRTAPSQTDIQLTQKIKDAVKLLDMTLSDHVIIGNKTYFSFSDEGLL